MAYKIFDMRILNFSSGDALLEVNYSRKLWASVDESEQCVVKAFLKTKSEFAEDMAKRKATESSAPMNASPVVKPLKTHVFSLKAMERIDESARAFFEQHEKYLSKSTTFISLDYSAMRQDTFERLSLKCSTVQKKFDVEKISDICEMNAAFYLDLFKVQITGKSISLSVVEVLLEHWLFWDWMTGLLNTTNQSKVVTLASVIRFQKADGTQDFMDKFDQLSISRIAGMPVDHSSTSEKQATILKDQFSSLLTVHRKKMNEFKEKGLFVDKKYFILLLIHLQQ